MSTPKKKKASKKKKTPKRATSTSAEVIEEKVDMGASVNSIEEVTAQLESFKSAFAKGDKAKCKDLLFKLKLAILQFDLVPPFSCLPSVVAAQLSLARETLEIATLLAVQAADFKAFERNFAQVKAFYTDYGSLLEESERKWQLFGLNLLGLLAHNRIAEFHTELELITQTERENMYIKYPVELEQRLMEGNYNKVLRARKMLPMPEYAFFTDMLVKTVREKISECCEKAYEVIPLSDAKQMLLLEDSAALEKHITMRGWTSRDGSIVFKTGGASEAHLAPRQLVQQTLGYATELERIV
eukprot:gb/GEZN01010452.1/.p1 GENE.gb/GEZN01010452.1/~~gb/GEZN01010452.1/.p1  ORF type:complete len:299 (-),score=75.11 gb/GEZN01010452.1/:226-1122(-)